MGRNHLGSDDSLNKWGLRENLIRENHHFFYPFGGMKGALRGTWPPGTWLRRHNAEHGLVLLDYLALILLVLVALYM